MRAHTGLFQYAYVQSFVQLPCSLFLSPSPTPSNLFIQNKTTITTNSYEFKYFKKRDEFNEEKKIVTKQLTTYFSFTFIVWMQCIFFVECLCILLIHTYKQKELLRQYIIIQWKKEKPNPSTVFFFWWFTRIYSK